MNFFVKRYLFTTRELHESHLEATVLRWQYAASNDSLAMGFTEYMSLPLFLQNTILKNQARITDEKRESMSNIKASKF